MSQKYCQYCGKPIKIKESSFCENCGMNLSINSENHIVSGENMIEYHKNPYLATLLSIFPGIGQMYNGQVFKGILIKIIWQILIIISGLSLNITGIAIMIITYLMVWIYNLMDAYRDAKEVNENNGNYFYNENLKHNIHLNDSNKIGYKFERINIHVNSFFHNIKDGKKVVSIVKVVILIILFAIIGILLD
jgi:TM2 domain-containing membrane protein YozV